MMNGRALRMGTVVRRGRRCMPGMAGRRCAVMMARRGRRRRGMAAAVVVTISFIEGGADNGDGGHPGEQAGEVIIGAHGAGGRAGYGQGQSEGAEKGSQAFWKAQSGHVRLLQGPLCRDSCGGCAFQMPERPDVRQNQRTVMGWHAVQQACVMG